MGVAYSQDLRDRVMAAVDGGLGVYAAAPLFRVSVAYIYKALGRRRATGDVTTHTSGGGHWKTTTFIGALRQDGLGAPCAFDGPSAQSALRFPKRQRS